ncbi:hypothetical protein BH24PSE2_BH24PSE2_04330 [soil metagenome]
MRVSAGLAAAVLLSASVLAEETMERQAIDEANAKLIALQKDGDAAGMAEMYTEDATLLPAGGPKSQGRDAIREFWAGMIGPGLDDLELVTEDLVAVDENLAYEIGSYTATPRDAEPVTGQYLVLWRNVDGEWKLHVDIFNEDGHKG